MSNNSANTPDNGAVLTVTQIIKAVMSSTSEAKLGALFINFREAVPARHTLEEMGHTPPHTPMQTDDTTALGVVNINMATKQLKSLDMKFHWLRCRATQRQFRHYWRAGPTNCGDYVPKHHAAIHHCTIHPRLFTTKKTLMRLHHKQKINQGAEIQPLQTASAA